VIFVLQGVHKVLEPFVFAISSESMVARKKSYCQIKAEILKFMDICGKSFFFFKKLLMISQSLLDELRKVLGLIREFQDAAGLVINTDKSEILELGNYKNSADIGIPLVKMAKITGVWFSEDYQLMSDTN
jgi:hypothetical protein